MPKVITVSASYGANGDKVGHALAERLGIPFLDRAIPAALAHELSLGADVEESLDEHVPSRLERIAAAFANTSTPIGPSQIPPEIVETPEQFRAASEVRLREVADRTGGVVLGRAGMVVLGGRPDVLCVRLDGPVEGRIANVVARGLDEESARRGQREVDKARNSYAKVFFNVNQDDPKLYHLMLDATVLSVDACVDIIVRAAQDRFGDIDAS
jgi:cytidylate kinase